MISLNISMFRYTLRWNSQTVDEEVGARNLTGHVSQDSHLRASVYQSWINNATRIARTGRTGTGMWRPPSHDHPLANRILFKAWCQVPQGLEGLGISQVCAVSAVRARWHFQGAITACRERPRVIRGRFSIFGNLKRVYAFTMSGETCGGNRMHTRAVVSGT